MRDMVVPVEQLQLFLAEVGVWIPLLAIMCAVHLHWWRQNCKRRQRQRHQEAESEHREQRTIQAAKSELSSSQAAWASEKQELESKIVEHAHQHSQKLEQIKNSMESAMFVEMNKRDVEIKQLQATIDQKDVELGGLEKTIEDLRNEVSSVTKRANVDLVAAQKEHAKATSEADSIKKQLSAAQSENKQQVVLLKESTNKFESKIQSLQSELASKSQSLADALANSASVQQRVTQLESDLKAAQVELKKYDDAGALHSQTVIDLNRQLEEHKIQLRNRLFEHDAAVAQLNSGVLELQQQLSKRTAEVQTFLDQIRAKEFELEQSSADAAELKQQLAECQATIAQLESSVSQHIQLAADTDSRHQLVVADVQSQLSAKVGQISQQSLQLSEQRLQISNMEQRVDSLSSSLSSKGSIIDELSKSLSDCEAALQTEIHRAEVVHINHQSLLAQKSTEHSEVVERLHLQITALESKISALKQDVQETESQSNVQVKRISNAQEELQSLQSSKSTLTIELAAAQQVASQIYLLLFLYQQSLTCMFCRLLIKVCPRLPNCRPS
jgi:chromosome segregation ATPase